MLVQAYLVTTFVADLDGMFVNGRSWRYTDGEIEETVFIYDFYHFNCSQVFSFFVFMTAVTCVWSREFQSLEGTDDQRSIRHLIFCVKFGLVG